MPPQQDPPPAGAVGAAAHDGHQIPRSVGEQGLLIHADRQRWPLAGTRGICPDEPGLVRWGSHLRMLPRR
jgi:hypothetical protein